MKLKEFITSVLVDINDGISEAEGKTKRHTSLHTNLSSGDGGVSFDVAVTAGSEVGGSVGAEVFSIGAKGKGKLSTEEVSRIKFRVNVGSKI